MEFNNFGNNNCIDPNDINQRDTYPGDGFAFHPQDVLEDPFEQNPATQRSNNLFLTEFPSEDISAPESTIGGNGIQAKGQLQYSLDQIQAFNNAEENIPPWIGEPFGQKLRQDDTPTGNGPHVTAPYGFDANNMSFLQEQQRAEKEFRENFPEEFAQEEEYSAFEDIGDSGAFGGAKYPVPPIDNRLIQNDNLSTAGNGGRTNLYSTQDEGNGMELVEPALFVPQPQLAFPVPDNRHQPQQCNTSATCASANGPFPSQQGTFVQNQIEPNLQRVHINESLSVGSSPSTVRDGFGVPQSPSTPPAGIARTQPEEHLQNPSPPRGIKRPASELGFKFNSDVFEVYQSGRRSKKTKIYNPLNEADRLLLDTITSPNYEVPESIMFTDIGQVKLMLERAEGLYRKPHGDCTFPSRNPCPDQSFPQNNKDWKEDVKRIVDGIMDWSSYVEWMQVVDKTTKEKRSNELVDKIEAHERRKRNQSSQVHENALQVKDLTPPPGAIEKTVEAQQCEVLGRPCNVFTAECLAWKLVAAAIQSQQGNARNLPWTTNDGA